MNILVTGANGQLGLSLRRCIAENGCGDNDKYIFTDVVGDGIVNLDITDADAVNRMADECNADVIVNCAAYTNVERAEDDYDMAELLNSAAVKNLTMAAKRRDALLVHISTDYVFGGACANTPLAESEAPNPTGVYGITKLHGEEAVLASGCRHLIIRTAWLYSEYGKNFVKTMMNLTSSKPTLKVVYDQAGTPTYARDLACAIHGILSKRQYDGHEGVYHYSNEGVCSWYDFAVAIAGYAGNAGCEISPCRSDEFPSKVVRPSYSVLDKSKIKNAFGIKIPYWAESLKACVANLQKEDK